jgi:putative PEP-CTERM system histidine kinase
MTLDVTLAYSSAALAAVLAVGAAIRWNHSTPRWAFSAGMLALALERVFSGLALSSDLPLAVLQWHTWRQGSLALLPGFWLLFSLTYARGNAQEFLRRWRKWLVASFALPLLVTGMALAAPAGFLLGLGRDTDADAYVPVLGPGGVLFQLALLIATLLVLVNLERTFRASVGTVRWRIKFMLLGLGVILTVQLFTCSQALLFHITDRLQQTLNSSALLAGCMLIVRSLFRAGHFGREVYPSQSVLQGSVTILLAGLYLLIVGIFAKVATYFGSESAFAVKALVVLLLLVLLAVLLQSDRVTMYLRRFVSRHFQRPMYDYRTVWRTFTEGTASRVEPTEYCRAVVKLLTEIFQTLSVTLWLVDDHHERLTLAASTSLSERQALELTPNDADAAGVIRHLRRHSEPVDIERLQADWASTLRRCHPDEFHKGGTRVCVPIVSNGEMLALVLLGDRVGGAAFTLQDFDLLKSIGDHIASGLMNVRLSQRLLQAREHEAFQAMATFFVHDLKNAASTLNLMLQNLPDHFDDPAFREDALRGVAKSVAHIKHLISRLSQLRSELKIQPVSTDLNQIVRDAVAAFEPAAGFAVETDLRPLPPLPLDREQFGKVLTNLLLNAQEAANAGGAGRLRLSTRPSGAWAVLDATDNGCGMTPEFVARSLFRPFQTTKKSGLGIGMFQSKMIVEAHGGRIAVESTSGQGTTFRVFLPLASFPR